MSLHPEHLSQQATFLEFGPINKDVDSSNREVFFITIVCHPSQLEQAKQRLFAEHHCHEQTA